MEKSRSEILNLSNPCFFRSKKPEIGSDSVGWKFRNDSFSISNKRWKQNFRMRYPRSFGSKIRPFYSPFKNWLFFKKLVIFSKMKGRGFSKQDVVHSPRNSVPLRLRKVFEAQKHLTQIVEKGGFLHVEMILQTIRYLITDEKLKNLKF